MKKLTALVLLLSISVVIYAQSKTEVVIGKVDSIQSKVLNEQRKLWIHLPEGYNPENNYPVVYLLDGWTHFYSVVGLIRQFSVSNGNAIFPQMIVVGIHNTNRTRDLTPTKAEPNPPFLPEFMAKDSGGGANFMKFMETELIPYIESTYSTAPYRMFIGHSFGGLMVMNTFFYQPELFNSFIVIDPSLWFDNEKLAKAIESSSFTDDKYKGKALYLGIAGMDIKGKDSLDIMNNPDPFASLIKPNIRVDARLNKLSKGRFKYRSKVYQDDMHTSVPLITEYDAMRFIFESYWFDIKPDDIMVPNSDIIERMKAHYKNVSVEFGYPIKPDEGNINSFGYMLMQMQQMDMAGEFFKMNVYYYPESANVYDSLGDYYLAVNNKEKAMESFKKAIEINDYEASKEKLKKLENR